ncbi:hypothetical protein JCM10213_000431 [Rhodosporidiobolus nylandii]
MVIFPVEVLIIVGAHLAQTPFRRADDAAAVRRDLLRFALSCRPCYEAVRLSLRRRLIILYPANLEAAVARAQSQPAFARGVFDIFFDGFDASQVSRCLAHFPSVKDLTLARVNGVNIDTFRPVANSLERLSLRTLRLAPPPSTGKVVAFPHLAHLTLIRVRKDENHHDFLTPLPEVSTFVVDPSPSEATAGAYPATLGRARLCVVGWRPDNLFPASFPAPPAAVLFFLPLSSAMGCPSAIPDHPTVRRVALGTGPPRSQLPPAQRNGSRATGIRQFVDRVLPHLPHLERLYLPLDLVGEAEDPALRAALDLLRRSCDALGVRVGRHAGPWEQLGGSFAFDGRG